MLGLLGFGVALAAHPDFTGEPPQEPVEDVGWFTVAAEKGFVAELVAEGELSQEEADEWLAELEEAARSFVEDTFEDTLESIMVEPSP